MGALCFGAGLGCYNAVMKKAFTLLEIIVVIALVGVLAAMVYPSYSGIGPAGREQAAITKAETLNGAIFVYAKRIPNAASNWAAADNAGKYALLHAQGYLPNMPATLAGFQPAGFTFTLPGALNGRVAITGPSGAVSY